MPKVVKPVPDELLYLAGYLADQLDPPAPVDDSGRRGPKPPPSMDSQAAARRLRDAHAQCAERWAEQRDKLQRAAETLLVPNPPGEVLDRVALALVDIFNLDVEDVEREPAAEPVANLTGKFDGIERRTCPHGHDDVIRVACDDGSLQRICLHAGCDYSVADVWQDDELLEAMSAVRDNGGIDDGVADPFPGFATESSATRRFFPPEN